MIRRPFIVAELSANHNGTLERALRIVDAAADAGADAIKLQTWSTDSMVGDPDYVVQDGPWAGQNLRELYRKAQTPWLWHQPIFNHARARGLIPFSTPFDIEALAFLEHTTQCDIYKIASFELVDVHLIKAVAKTGKPMILSTGMATFEEISRAWHTAYLHGCRDITLLKCTSAYPAIATSVNLAAMQRLRQGFEGDYTSVGISDHTMGSAVAVAATALGAAVIEKHLTLSRADGGPDASFSMEPDEFAAMVKDCRTAAEALGTVCWGPAPGESTALRRSLWLTKDIKAGEILTGKHVRSARPALGLDCSKLTDALGRRAIMDYRGGQPLKMEMFT